MDLSTVFHSVNPPDNSSLSHCSSGLISALLVLLTVYLFMKVSLNGLRAPARLPCAADVSGEEGILEIEVHMHWLRSVGPNAYLWPGRLLYGCLGWPDPLNRLVMLIRRQGPRINREIKDFCFL